MNNRYVDQQEMWNRLKTALSNIGIPINKIFKEQYEKMHNAQEDHDNQAAS